MDTATKLFRVERDMYRAIDMGRHGEFRRLAREVEKLRQLRARERDLEAIDRAASVDAPCPEDWDNQTPDEREAIERAMSCGGCR